MDSFNFFVFNFAKRVYASVWEGHTWILKSLINEMNGSLCIAYKFVAVTTVSYVFDNFK